MTSIEDRVSAIVLAGGKSSRMGRDKALLRLGDRTLLNHVCSIATRCTTQTYVVTPWIEKYRDDLPPRSQAIEEKLVLDTVSNTPLIGFSQGLRLISTEWVLLLACDLPFLSSSQVKQWLTALTTVLPTEIAVLPRGVKGWEPLCGFYRQGCLFSLDSYLERGGKSFQGWLAQQSVRELELSDRRCLFNCNTPEDWAAVHSQS